ncbi:hypothetical protein [Amycolatopsis sp. NPDC003676]
MAPENGGPGLSPESLEKYSPEDFRAYLSEINDRHPENSREVLLALEHLPPEDFVNHHLLGRLPWLFQTWTLYRNWKTELARGLQVDPHDIIVVGSSALGFSLSPDKNFSAFHNESDVDVAVISMRHFNLAWQELRDLDPAARLHPSMPETGYLKKHRESLVFDGSIATDKILPFISFGYQWTTELARTANRKPTTGRDVRCRIYQDSSSLRNYHVKNVQNLRQEISSAHIRGSSL